MPLNINTEVGILPVPGHPIRVAQDGTWLIQSIADAVTVNTHAVTQSGIWTVKAITDPVTVSTHAVTQSGTWNIGTVATITNPVTVNTHAVTQSGSWAVSVSSGSITLAGGNAKIGTVSIDQTTDGTTNKVYVGNTISAAQSGAWTIKSITDAVTVNTHAVTQSGAWNIGTVSGVSGTVTIKADTAANQANSLKVTLNNESLNVATHAVTQSGDFLVKQSGAWTIAATQSGTWNVNVSGGSLALSAGTAKIGQIAIDQTTDGTTNKVYIGNTPSVSQSGTWTVKSITDPVTVSTHAVTQSGTWTVKSITDPVTVNTHAVSQSGTWNIGSIASTVTVDGTVAATQSGTWNVGSVTGVVTVKADTLSNQTNALKVTLSNESLNVATHAVTQGGTWNISSITNAVAVTDNNGSLTVDGTVAVSSIPAIPTGSNKIGSVDIANVADVMFNARLVDYAIADNTATAIEISLPSGYNQAFIEHVVVIPDGDTKMFDFRIYEHRNAGSWYEKECIYFADDMQGRLDDFSRLYYVDAESIGKIHCRVITAAGGGGNYTIKLKGRLMR